MKVLVIPLGGQGKRFVDAGYTDPKPLIKALGRPIILWVLKHIKLSEFDYVVVPYHPDLQRYRFADLLHREFPRVKFVFSVLPDILCGSGQATDPVGAAVTLRFALEQFAKELEPRDVSGASVLCMDGDNFYPQHDISLDFVKRPGNMVFCQDDMKGHPQGEASPFSHAQLETPAGDVLVGMVEKRRVSQWACTGAYGFEKLHELLGACNEVINAALRAQEQTAKQQECYISHVVQRLIDDHKHVTLQRVLDNNWVCLGTPLQLRLFTNNMPRRTVNSEVVVPSLRVCFDLDNTLVTYPDIKTDYTTARPIPDMIEFVRYLKRFGHTIIIQTARRMATHGGNQGRLLKDIGMLTFKQLEDFDIPYDEIYFGKPQADVYIDDLGVSAFDDVRMKLGFYDDAIDCRNFHALQFSNIDSVVKRSAKPNGLEGEVFFYQHIPHQLKDMFPVLIRAHGNSMLEIERIHGVPVSKLFLSRQLTTNNLQHILSSLQRLHSAVPFDVSTGDDVYVNYVHKIQQRREQSAAAYAALPQDAVNAAFDSVVARLQDYQAADRAIKAGVIHGDPVFTNILFNQLGKLKFIDMRGRLGDVLSIQGDALYDYAKVYQSLCGYDEALSDLNTVEQVHRAALQKTFWEHIRTSVVPPNSTLEQVRADLVAITRSLVLSLIPLHDERRALPFFKLLDNIN